MTPEKNLADLKRIKVELILLDNEILSLREENILLKQAVIFWAPESSDWEHYDKVINIVSKKQ